jgi:hypothetical protein
MTTLSIVEPQPVRLGDIIHFADDGYGPPRRVRAFGHTSPSLNPDGTYNPSLVEMIWVNDLPLGDDVLLGSHGSAWLSNGGPAWIHAELYRSSGGKGLTIFDTLDFDALGAP